MKKFILVLIGAALIASGQAFAKPADPPSQIDFETANGQADSTTQIDFETSDGQVIPVSENLGYHPKDILFLPWNFTLACFAPTTILMSNGLHQFVLEGSRWPFVVDAQGSPQRWLLTREAKGLNLLGNIFAGTGIAAFVLEILYIFGKTFIIHPLMALAHSDYAIVDSADYIFAFGGGTLILGGIIMVMFSQPKATRIQ